MDKPQQLLVATFETEGGAKDALKALKDWGKENDLEVVKAATLKKDSKGHISVDQDQDVSPGAGTVFGAVVGGVLGLLGGPGGAMVGAAAGAATGGAAATAVNFGFSDKELDTMKAGLRANTSALIAVTEDHYADSLDKELKRLSGRTWRRPVPEDYYRHMG